MEFPKAAAVDDLASPEAADSSAFGMAAFAGVLSDHVDVLFRQARLDYAMTFVLSVLPVIALWSGAQAVLIGFWWIALQLVAAARFGLVTAYERGLRYPNEQWLRWFALGALASGVLWGLGGSLFFLFESDQKQIFAAFLLSAVLAGGIPLYCSVWWVYALYGAGVVAPFVYLLSATGIHIYIGSALIAVLIYALCVAIAGRLSRVFSDAFRLRRAHANLADDHAGLSAQMQEQMEELVQAQREVEASGRKLALFAERAPIAVFELDRNGTVLDANPAAENIFGFTNTELGGRNLLRTLIAENEPLGSPEWWNEFTAGAQPASGMRATCVRRDGLEIICEFSLTPLVNLEGELISVIAQCRDITQQLEAERLKKEFTSTLSHELRTPLTSIIGSLQLINSGMFGEMDKDVAELTVVAERNGQRLLDLINDILDIEKIESGKFTLQPESVLLNELVKDSMVLNRAFADRFEVSLELRDDAPNTTVNADRKRLLQVMTNLISNAAKFSPRGGRVDIGISTGDDGMVTVSVEDRGPGIPAEFRTRIFSRFAQADSAYTRQKGGTGLGLAICKRLIELMDGSVGFVDRPGGGTVFFFELPLLKQPEMAS